MRGYDDIAQIKRNLKNYKESEQKFITCGCNVHQHIYFVGNYFIFTDFKYLNLYFAENVCQKPLFTIIWINTTKYYIILRVICIFPARVRPKHKKVKYCKQNYLIFGKLSEFVAIKQNEVYLINQVSLKQSP